MSEDHPYMALWLLAGILAMPVAGLVAGLFKIFARALHVRVALGHWPSQSPEAKRMYLGEPREPS